ncbi:ABC transporter permease [Ciceribacter naphthalenivorans]|uniref:ABC transporter permease n=3 Tax=Pseudomonadota TaxID=1224 RepID=A0A512HIC0_9HYPH|nr:ABC transporter permease [Ciceribacter naphthalenivorans]GLR24467.1 ABC transporter permease [Ciceribacter naphthalenivorans]GLT07323.1 ABC transporter permease [Sphingomonas psychrolutea]
MAADLHGAQRMDFRAVRRRLPAPTVAALVVSAFVAMPIVAIFLIGITGGSDNWQHMLTNVVPRATGRTLLLLAMTGALTAVIGIASAWLVASCDFPFRRLLSVALVLPLAIPSYLAAYAFGEFLDFTGPVQTFYRSLFGFQSARDYSFPDIRSLGGAVLVMTAVLYPYVYLACRSMFLMQGRAAADVARTLGAGPWRVFARVQIPMARPAIMVGLTLVMMETLNDIGAVEYLGVQTLTFSIYDTWLNRGSLAGAAQIASVLLVFVVLLLWIERQARRRQRFASQKTTAVTIDAVRLKLSGWRGFGATLICAFPALVGFVIPVAVLAGFALRRIGDFTEPRLLRALGNSITISSAAALATVILGFVLAYAARSDRSRLTASASRLASLGYGIPGTVLAIGVLIPLASLDNFMDGVLRQSLGISTGLLLSGTGFAIVYAATVRFLAMAEGTIDSGFQKLSPHLDMAARTLGRNALQTFRQVLLPNMRPAVLTAALLVFIETLKELSATILLRPFNFNTLATLVYEDASRSKVQDASVAAIIIILAGLIPVILVSRSLDRGR